MSSWWCSQVRDITPNTWVLSQVLGDELPPKIETKVVVPLSKMQRFLYSAILTQDLSALISAAGLRPSNHCYIRRPPCTHTTPTLAASLVHLANELPTERTERCGNHLSESQFPGAGNTSVTDRKSTKRSAVPLEYARLSSLLMHLRKVCPINPCHSRVRSFPYR